jgi:hypothetical protein
VGGGGFYSHGDRDYGQNLLVAGFQDLTGIPTVGLRAPKDVLFFSDLGYKLNQFALFGEATFRRRIGSASPAAFATITSARTRSRSSTASSPTTTPARRWCRSRARRTPTTSRRA